jgi:hypothetical protein
MQKNTSRLAKVAKASVGLAACVAVTVAAYAAVTFDADTGEGFVGKGDVQLIYGWNNKLSQDNALLVQFRYESTESVTWLCIDDPDQQGQPVSNTRTITTGIAGELNGEPRSGPQQFTGFNLLGWEGTPVVTEDEDAPELHSCSASRVWDSSTPDVVVSLGGGLQVSIDGTNWYSLPLPEVL